MKIVRKAIEMGNGAAVYVPREYKGRQVLIVLPEGIEEIKKRVLTRLVDFMPNVLGVYLYGSYARGESTRESDIDLLVIAEKKDDRIKACFEDIDVRVLTLESVKNSIRNFPVPIVPILREAEVFLNPLLLEELKQEKIDFRKLKWHFQDIKRIIKITEMFIDIDDKDIDTHNIYSLIMRARVLFMIECLLKNKIFSNEVVKKKLLGYGLNEGVFNNYYQIYQRIRDNGEAKEKINKEEIEKLIKIIKKYSKAMENETKKEARKRT